MFLTRLSQADGVLCCGYSNVEHMQPMTLKVMTRFKQATQKKIMPMRGSAMRARKKTISSYAFILVITDCTYVTILLAIVPQTSLCNIYNLVTVTPM